MSIHPSFEQHPLLLGNLPSDSTQRHTPRRYRTPTHMSSYIRDTTLGAPFPPGGITLVTQVKEGSRWQTFDELPLKKEGTSRVFKYTFAKTFHPTTYTFRLALPATGSGGYPFAFGASNTVNVRVNP